MTATDLATRSRRLLESARYLTLATTSREGHPWSATVHFVWSPGPGRLSFVSPTGSEHGRHVAERPAVAGSLFITGVSTDVAIAPVDGAQFTGRCGLVPPESVGAVHDEFFRSVFPDPVVREAWTPPVSDFDQPSEHGLYVVDIERWWLIDTRTWAEDRIDRRIDATRALPVAGSRR